MIFGSVQPSFAQQFEGRRGSPCDPLLAVTTASAQVKAVDPYTEALATFGEDPQNWDNVPLSAASLVAYSVARGVEVSEKTIAKVIDDAVPTEAQMRKRIRKTLAQINKVGFFSRLGRWFVVSDSEMKAIQLGNQIEEEIIASLSSQGRLRQSTRFENLRFKYWTDAHNFQRIVWASAFSAFPLSQGLPPAYLPEIDVLRRNPRYAQRIQTGIRLVAAAYFVAVVGFSSYMFRDQFETFQLQLSEQIQLRQQQEIESRERYRNLLREELERQLRLNQSQTPPAPPPPPPPLQNQLD